MYRSGMSMTHEITKEQLHEMIDGCEWPCAIIRAMPNPATMPINFMLDPEAARAEWRPDLLQEALETARGGYVDPTRWAHALPEHMQMAAVGVLNFVVHGFLGTIASSIGAISRVGVRVGNISTMPPWLATTITQHTIDALLRVSHYVHSQMAADGR